MAIVPAHNCIESSATEHLLIHNKIFQPRAHARIEPERLIFDPEIVIDRYWDWAAKVILQCDGLDGILGNEEMMAGRKALEGGMSGEKCVLRDFELGGSGVYPVECAGHDHMCTPRVFIVPPSLPTKRSLCQSHCQRTLVVILKEDQIPKIKIRSGEYENESPRSDVSMQ